MHSTRLRPKAVAALLALLVLAGMLFFPGAASAAVTVHDRPELPAGGLTGTSLSCTIGPDGAIWFTEPDEDLIGRYDPNTQELDEYPIPGGISDEGYLKGPYGITTGPDGLLWFCEMESDTDDHSYVGSVDPGVEQPVTPVIEEYKVPTDDSWPCWIAAGPDDAMWFTLAGADKIGRIDTVDHEITEYPLPDNGDTSWPWVIAAGPDDAMWFSQFEGDRIGRIDIVTKEIDEWDTFSGADSVPTGLCVGPDGAVWYNENQTDRVCRLDPADPDNQTAYDTGEEPTGIATGPDDALWIAERVANSIRRLDPADPDNPDVYPCPTVDSSPTDIIPGPKGSMWFCQMNNNRIGQVEISPFTIKATVQGGHGRITPSGKVKVENGADQKFVITPDSGYRVKDVLVDGKSAGPRSSYVFKKVLKNHAISASFAPAGPPPPPPPPPPPTTWYLAEGTTAWGFSTCISIQNPNESPVQARVTYMPTGRDNVTENVTLPAESQTTITNDALLESMGGPCDFSTKVEGSDETKPIAADRTMEWTGPGAPSPEGHSSVGVTSPAKTWYLPEGSASWGFETWLLIQNPQGKEAVCQVTYMIENVGPRTVEKKIPARSRASFNMADDMPDVEIKDASIKVESSVPIIPERAMYRNDRREGHDSIGTTEQAKEYYLAEGATGWNVGYTTWVLVQNPGDKPNDVKLTYQTAGGPVDGPAFQMPPNSRKTVRVNDTLPPDTDVSTLVRGTKPVIAERAMYWDNGTGEACHASIGLSSPHNAFMLPDGQTSEGRETWTLVQNPGKIPVEIEVSYLPEGGGKPVSFTDTIGPNSRKTYDMAEKGVAGRASVLVEVCMGGPVIAERAMYWNSRGAGTCTIGGPMSSRRAR